MKKILKVTAIVIAIIFALLIILPYTFKGRIVETAKTEINKSVNAEVDFGTFRISLIRNFPNISLRLNDLSVKGVDVFEDVTLAEIGSIFVTIDLFSLFGGDGIEVRSVRLDDLEVNVIVLEDGQANWDIMIPSEEIDEEEADDDAEPFEFKLALQNFEIRRGNIVYDDRPFDVYIEMINLNHKLKGDFTADFATISTPYTTAESFTMHVEGIPLFTRVFLDLVADIDVDFSQFHFTFKENELLLNDLALGFDGYFAMPSGEPMNMDISFVSKKDDIRSFISLVPVLYAHEFESIKTSGNFALNGRINGIMKGEIIPSFNINILLEDGMFSYPDLPESVSDIQVKASIFNEGQYVDQTVIDISRFSFSMAENPVSAVFKLKTPVSDPDFAFDLDCDLDLSAIGQIFPMPEGEEVKGKIKGNIFAEGRLSLIEQGQYNQLKAGGSFEFRNIEYRSAAIDEPVELKELVFALSPRYFQLSSMDLKYGETNLRANGRVDNVFGFLFDDDQLLSGSFDLWANYVNLNEFMAEMPEQPEEETEPIELSIIHVPENIDFTLNARIDQVLFGDIDVTNITGKIRVVDQQARMENLRMNMLDGRLTLSGAYGTSEPDFADIDFSMQMENFDIQKSFNTFNTIQTLAPVGEYSHGKISAALKLEAKLDDKLNPVLETMEGGGRLSSPGIRVDGPPSMQKIADGLKMDKLKEIELSEFLVRFTFSDGRLEFDPFDIKFGKSSATIGGETYFDTRINYDIRFSIPRSELGEQANQVIGGMVSQASAIGLTIRMDEYIKVDAKVTGTFTNPEVTLGLSDMIRSTARDVEEQLRDRVEEEVREVVEEARELISEEREKRAEQVLSEAHKQADRVREESKNAAQAVRDEVKEQAAKLEREASGAIAKAAARRTGEGLINRANTRANQLEKEGENTAQRIIDEAEAKAEQIRAGEE